MKRTQLIDVMYTHTEGEPTCIVPGGIMYPPGADLIDKRRYLQAHYDWLRCALMREPRGHHHMFGVFLTPPSSAQADAGMIWMDGERFVDMCGHGTIALSMAVVSHGLIPRAVETNNIRYETTAGLVVAEVESDAENVYRTHFQNVPAFVEAQDIPVELPGFGELKADIAFGGNYFGIIKWHDKDLRINPETGSQFAQLGLIAKKQLNEKIRLRHPINSDINDINFVTFWHEPDHADSFYRNIHVFSDGKCDRSPGGTGTSAMMAMFEARGKLGLNQPIYSEGLLGSGRFQGCLLGETKVGDKRAVTPRVSGTANMTGYAKWLVDPQDPLRTGFVIR